MIQTSGIDHIVLHCSDIGRAKTFYTEILGMTVYRENDAQVFMHAGGQGVALFKTQGEAPLTIGNDLNHLALNVAGGTYETLKAELESRGVARWRPARRRPLHLFSRSRRAPPAADLHALNPAGHRPSAARSPLTASSWRSWSPVKRTIRSVTPALA